MNIRPQQKKAVLHVMCDFAFCVSVLLEECFLRTGDTGNLLQVLSDAYFPPTMEQTLDAFDDRPTDFNYEPTAGLQRVMGLRD